MLTRICRSYRHLQSQRAGSGASTAAADLHKLRAALPQADNWRNCKASRTSATGDFDGRCRQSRSRQSAYHRRRDQLTCHRNQHRRRHRDHCRRRRKSASNVLLQQAKHTHSTGSSRQPYFRPPKPWQRHALPKSTQPLS
jgi:hypothetical protein